MKISSGLRASLIVSAGLFLLQSGFISAEDTVGVRAKGKPAATESFWSDNMMDEATPLPFYDEESDLNADPSYWYNLGESVGPPGSVTGGISKSGNQDSTFNDEPRGKSAGQDGDGSVDFLAPQSSFSVDFGTQNKFDSFAGYREKWANTVYPWKAVGKLFFSTPSGTASCSASVISPRDAIVTAAHCCYDRSAQRWYSNWVFVPGKDNAAEPYGRFGWVTARVLTSWITSGGRENDVCVIKTRAGLSNKTGYLGRSWNQPQTEHVFTFGYPGNMDGGNRQNVCASENYPNCGSSLVNATGCDKTYGDSGAPWIRTYKPRQTGARNYVNSVTSGWDGCTGTFGQSYNGARFTSNNIVPLCRDLPCD